MTVERSLTRLGRSMDRLLPADYTGAIVMVGPGGEVACHHNMDPVKLAIVLGKLTEELVREAKRPIFEGGSNHADRP